MCTIEMCTIGRMVYIAYVSFMSYCITEDYWVYKHLNMFVHSKNFRPYYIEREKEISECQSL